MVLGSNLGRRFGPFQLKKVVTEFYFLTEKQFRSCRDLFRETELPLELTKRLTSKAGTNLCYLFFGLLPPLLLCCFCAFSLLRESLLGHLINRCHRFIRAEGCDRWRSLNAVTVPTSMTKKKLQTKARSVFWIVSGFPNLFLLSHFCRFFDSCC